MPPQGARRPGRSARSTRIPTRWPPGPAVTRPYGAARRPGRSSASSEHCRRVNRSCWLGLALATGEPEPPPLVCPALRTGAPAESMTMRSWYMPKASASGWPRWSTTSTSRPACLSTSSWGPSSTSLTGTGTRWKPRCGPRAVSKPAPAPAADRPGSCGRLSQKTMPSRGCRRDRVPAGRSALSQKMVRLLR